MHAITLLLSQKFSRTYGLQLSPETNPVSKRNSLFIAQLQSITGLAMLKFRRLLSVIFALILFGLTPHAAAKSGSTKIVGDEIEIVSASGEHFSEYSGANVLDGDLSNQSVFASRLNPADLFLDLGEVWTVESIRLAWGCLLYTSPSPRDRG